MSRLLRRLFVLLVAYPVVLLWLGLLVRNRERLPLAGPAIIAANHNSHLDILALYSLFPLKLIPRVRPVAAADYFLRNRWLAWFSLHVVGIVPVVRSGNHADKDPLADCYAALERGEILVIFPEGSRGDAEVLTRLKSGIWHLTRRHPEVPITPVFMHGLGRSMPRGAWIPLPLFVDVFVGGSVEHNDDKHLFMQHLTERFQHMQAAVVPDAEQQPKERQDA